VKLPSADTKTVFLNGKKGIRKRQVILDFAAGVPPQLVVKDGRISCVPMGCSGSITLAPSPELYLKAAGGTVVEVGSDKFTVPADGTLVKPLSLALSPPLQNQSLAKFCVGRVTGSTKSPVVASTNVALTLPGGGKTSVKVDLDAHLVEAGLAKALAEVKDGAIVFPWEKAGAPARGKRAAVYVSGDHCYDAGQAGATVGDLDVVAISNSDTRESECIYHVTDGTVRNAKIKMHDENAEVFDRVTGKKLGAKKFLAPKDCDDTVTVTRAITMMNDQYGFVNDETIGKWAATFAK
jgi:hypothetical protein